MITVNAYPDVDDGEGLAARANELLENYKSPQARVLKTSSVPRTADRPAEHLHSQTLQPTRPPLQHGPPPPKGWFRVCPPSTAATEQSLR